MSDEAWYQRIKQFVEKGGREEDEMPELGDADVDTVVDVIWLLDLAYSSPAGNPPTGGQEPSPLQQRLALALGHLAGRCAAIVPLAQERLEPRLLESARLIDSAQVLQKRVVRMNTNIYYRQAKYNIFGEEPEGYSRLFALLSEVTLGDCADAAERVMELVGVFSLDPNRVADCAIEAMAGALQLSTRADIGGLLAIISRLGYGKDRLGEVVSLRLLRPWTGAKDEQVSFYSYGLTLAIMVKEGLLDLQHVVSSLFSSPKTDHGPVGRLPQGGDPFGFHDTTLLLAESLGSHSKDRLMCLVDGLLRTGQFENALLVMSSIDRAKEQISRYPPAWISIASILESLLSAIGNMLYPSAEPLNSSHFIRCSPGGLKEYWRGKDPVAELVLWYGLLGAHGHVSPSLLTGTCDYLQREKHPGLDHVVVLHLLPAMALGPPNAAVVASIWRLIGDHDYPTRFALYAEWLKSHGSGTILAAAQVITGDVKRLLRRLSKENVKQSGRLLGKLFCQQPLTAAAIVLEQAKAYENMIVPLADCCRYLQPLATDCLVFLIVRELRGIGRGKMKADGLNAAGWLQHVALFIGHLVRRYPVDLSPVFDLLLDSLFNGGSGDELVIVVELLKRVGGVEVNLTSVNEQQLEAHFGGPVLRQLAATDQTPAADARQMQRASQRVLETLRDRSRLVLLWTALARQPTVTAHKKWFDAEELKAQSHAFDLSHEVFLALGMFLERYSSAELLSQVSAGMDELGSRYSVPIELDRHIRRVVSTVTAPEAPADGGHGASSFWSLQSIVVPAARYEHESQKLKALATLPGAPAKDKELALANVLKLEAECKALARTTEQLMRDIKSGQIPTPEPHDMLKRALVSQQDAVYCAHFALASGQDLLGSLFLRLELLLKGFSEREAVCYGRFLSVLLGQINQGLTQEASKLRVMELHLNIYTAILEALTSTRFIEMRNAILILTRLDGHFPLLTTIGHSLEQCVRRIHEREKREDLRVLATRCQAILTAARPRLFAVDTAEIRNEEDQGVVDLAAAFNAITAQSEATEGSEDMARGILNDAIEEGEHYAIEEASVSRSPERKRRHQEDGAVVGEERTLPKKRRHEEAPRLDPRAESYRPEMQGQAASRDRDPARLDRTERPDKRQGPDKRSDTRDRDRDQDRRYEQPRRHGQDMWDRDRHSSRSSRPRRQ